ncbi:MAG: glycosyltransferase family 4 protein [Dehalococcoidia bacterium]|nr:glycosyltransferase family 4 protein [Dehalococcoidia bacterium]
MGHGNSAPRLCLIRLSHFPGDPRLEREVAALVEAGFAVDVVCIKRGKQGARALVAGAEVYRLPLHHRRKGKLSYVLEYLLSFLLASVLTSCLHLFRHYKVVQVNTLPDFLVFVALVPRLLGARVLLDMQEVTPELYASRFHVSQDSAQVRLMALLERVSASFAHAILCVSEPTREALVRRGIPADKLHVVMNVADDQLFPSLPPEHPGPDSDGSLRLMSHGTVVERHGLQVAIEAVALVRQHVPGIHFSILGEGEYLPQLQALATRLGVEDSISFHGYVPLHEIPSYISGCHGGIVSNLRDCFMDLVLPTKLMEYVAMGKPVIASRTKAIQSYFDDSMVLFFEPGQAHDLAQRILELYRDSDRGVGLARNAQDFLRRYPWQTTREAYVGVVRHLAAAAAN